MLDRRPMIGTVHRIVTHTITRRTAGQQIRQVRPSNWEPRDQIEWTFDRIPASELAELRTWFSDNAGLTVTLTDEWGVSWSGMVTSPEIEVEQTHRGGGSGSCDNTALYSLRFEFEGVRV